MKGPGSGVQIPRVMNKATLVTVCTVRNWNQADQMIGWLRGAGLHAMNLPLPPRLSTAGPEAAFPIQVPVEEADAAKELLDSYPGKERLA
jgi:hypothetical protein